MAHLIQGWRRLVRSPGFAIVAVGTLVAGIGINSAMFSLMDALLFRPPAEIAEPAAVVRLQFRVGDSTDASFIERSSYPTFLDLRDQGPFQAVAAYSSVSVSVGQGPHASLEKALAVSREFFAVLRSRPEIGGFHLAGSGVPDDGDGAVISYGLWQRQFGGDPQVIGKPLRVDGKTYAIAGVAPRGLQAPSAQAIDLWLPLEHVSVAGTGPKNWRLQRGRYWLEVIARLKPDQSPVIASERATAILANRRAAIGDRKLQSAIATSSIVPGRSRDKPLETRVSLWLSTVSALVLLIACANVGNLVLARIMTQRREYFVRLMLGASAGDLARRLLSDIVLIVVPGCIGALLLSFVMRNGIAVFLPGDIPLSRHFWDARTLLALGLTAFLTFVLLSAVSLGQLRALMRTSRLLGRANEAKNLGKGTRRLLLGLQGGVCLILVFAAGLFTQSLRRLQSLDLGVDLERTVQITMNLRASSRTPAETRALYERAIQALRASPDVELATLSEGSPYMSGAGAAPWTAERSMEALWAHREETAYRSVVGPRFFTTVGVRALRGRDFSESDRTGAEPVAIINAPLARFLWPDQEAVGRCLWLDDASTCIRVVGVLNGVWKFNVLQRNQMAIYLPLLQVPDAVPGAIFVRPRSKAEKFLAQARSIVQGVQSDLPAVRVTAAREAVDPQFRPWRLGASVFSAFAIVALIIVAIGLYGVVTITAALRIKEIAIRMSLGARWPQILRVALAEGVGSVAVGLCVGGLVALAASRRLAPLLFQTSPGDTRVLLQTALVLLAVALLAVAVPTIRAIRTNMAAVLRTD